MTLTKMTKQNFIIKSIFLVDLVLVSQLQSLKILCNKAHSGSLRHRLSSARNSLQEGQYCIQLGSSSTQCDIYHLPEDSY